jgi:hypothetical protein
LCFIHFLGLLDFPVCTSSPKIFHWKGVIL